MALLHSKRFLLNFMTLVFMAGLFPLHLANATTLHSAIDRYKAGDFKSAIEQWEQLARMGNPDALFNLGQVYRMGNGVDMDLAKVEYFYRRAAQSGHMEAQNNLASFYFFDDENTSRRGEALTWWRLAARQGHGQSQYMLAVLHYNGEFLPKDNIQAFAWVVLAREAGVEAAMVAERVMRRTLSVNEMTQGRLLSRGLLETPLNNRSYNTNVLDPNTAIQEFALAVPPLVQDAPKTPPSPKEPPSATMVMAEPAAPPIPVQAPAPKELPAERQITQAHASPHGRFVGWSIQMGSFRSQQNANNLYERISSQQTSLMQGFSGQVAMADLGERGVYYRLLIGEFENKAQAAEHCNKFKSVGYDCIAIAP